MTSSSDNAEIRRILRAQDGVIARAQARAAGLSAEAIRRQVESGAWLRAGHGAFRAADHADTPRGRVVAAVLSVGEDATVVGATAMWWWRMIDTPPADVQLAVPLRRRPRPRAGVDVRRVPVDPVDRMLLDGVAVTKRAPSVLAAAADAGELAGARLFDRALQGGHVGLEQLREAHVRTSGRHGATVCGRLITLAAGGARSEAERAAHRELRAAGIGGWIADYQVRLPGFGAAVLDLAFPGRRVLVEIDGWAYHRDLRAFLRDTRRQNALVVTGWTVIRTNWFELREHPERFVAAVRAALHLTPRVLA